MAWFYIFVLFLILIITLVLLFFSFSFFVGLIMAGGVPFISLPKKDWLHLCRSADLKSNQVVYDLGCGKANLLLTAVKNYDVRGVGYEISLWPYLWAHLKSWKYKNRIELHLKNFFKADLSRADVIFCYLFPETMAKLEEKFEKELSPGSKVVAYAFKLPNRQPDKIIEKPGTKMGIIYVYQY